MTILVDRYLEFIVSRDRDLFEWGGATFAVRADADGVSIRSCALPSNSDRRIYAEAYGQACDAADSFDAGDTADSIAAEIIDWNAEAVA